MAVYLKGKEVIHVFFTKNKFRTSIRVSQESLTRKKQSLFQTADNNNNNNTIHILYRFYNHNG